MFSHPLDPISVTELSSTVRILSAHFNGQRLRFKFIDLLECSKTDVAPYLQAEHLGHSLPPPPNRRTKVYFHRVETEVFQKGIVNVTTEVVESIQELPDVQGPVDYDEFEQIEKLCNNHPEVLKEVAKLKLPEGYVLLQQQHISALRWHELTSYKERELSMTHGLMELMIQKSAEDSFNVICTLCSMMTPKQTITRCLHLLHRYSMLSVCS